MAIPDLFCTPAQLAFGVQAKTFAVQIRPTLRQHDAAHTSPPDLLPQLAQQGYLGICLPQSFGGGGQDYLTLAVLAAVLESADSSVREVLAVHLGLHACSIWQWGTPAQQARWLPSLASGQISGAFALNEPNAGSDVASLQSTAQAVTGGYLLNGQKSWITLANTADQFLYFAKTDQQAGANGITAFVVERQSPGLTSTAIRNKFGVWASDTGHLTLQDVFVPDHAVLGQLGEGFKIALSAIDQGRYIVAAGSVGLQRECLRIACAYAQQRQAFGRPIAQQPLIQAHLAEMQQRLELSELLVYKVGRLKNKGERTTQAASQAKWYCTTAAHASAQAAMQILASAGFDDQYDIARHLRNSQAALTYQGTTEIHQLIQAGYLLGNRHERPLRCPPPHLD